MNKERNKNKRSDGFILLLLILSLLFSMKFGIWGCNPKEVNFDEKLYVQITGDIKSPGVYSFSQNPRLKDLIDRAGGFAPNKGCLDELKDSTFHSGDKVDVLWNGYHYDVTINEISSFHKLTLGIPISLNSETEIGLTALPGIGPKLAKNIIVEKDKRDGFKTLGDLMTVPGISVKKFKRIARWITL